MNSEQTPDQLHQYLLNEYSVYAKVGRECALAYLSALTSAAFLCADPASADAIRDFKHKCESQKDD